MSLPIIALGKSVSAASKLLNRGAGGTWPGEIALKLDPHILKKFFSHTKNIILVAGTNGKTTTSKMIVSMLRQHQPHASIVHNSSGANLLNGLVSAYISSSQLQKRSVHDYAVLEVDENSLPLALAQIDFTTFDPSKLTIVLLNLFRDQLDRYGEVDTIARKWHTAFKRLPKQSTLILNADDPQIAAFSEDIKAKTLFFGIEDPKKFQPTIDHATDSTFCLRCGATLAYKGTYFSHLGIWYCPQCKYHRPNPTVSFARRGLAKLKAPLPGLYNEYNTLAAVAVAQSAEIPESTVIQSLKDFKPAFGRLEKFSVQGRQIILLLSKNPAGFNASLRAVIEKEPKAILLVLNDRIPDGRDVSWIWDVDFEMIHPRTHIVTSGDRAYDMGLRIKYTKKDATGAPDLQVVDDLSRAIDVGTKQLKTGETLYILATYSAMLEVRKIIGGRKIL